MGDGLGRCLQPILRQVVVQVGVQHFYYASGGGGGCCGVSVYVSDALNQDRAFYNLLITQCTQTIDVAACLRVSPCTFECARAFEPTTMSELRV